ncbi:LacI family DNA-binding transcriptional regulator [Modestobacter versicolor]|uniref:LacI family DNA-binding transcriptional regulator n=1 Tax=Modestobacter versicolor TaxID=429133 RepID=UPI0034DEEAF4
MAAVTLSAVAQLAGVSISTASRALTGHPSVLPDTRERVQAAAGALRYHPNRMAKALRTRRTGLLGLVVNNLWNGTFSTIAETVQAWGATAGYQVLVCSTGGDPAREAAFLGTVAEHQFDGVVIAGSGGNADRVNRLLENGTAVVTMNREVAGGHAPAVMPAYDLAARLAVEHLLGLGHTRIGVVGGLDRFTSGRQHHLGYVEALGAAGLPVDPALVRRGPFTQDFGRTAAGELLDLPVPPTALLVSNHEASFGVLAVLSERGVDLPGRLSLLLTEDEPFFAWWNPPLSVVDTRAAYMASTAVRLLTDQLRDGPRAVPDPAAAGELVQPVLVHRSSTGPPAAG